MSQEIQSVPSIKPVITTKEIWALTWPQALMMLLQFCIGMTDVVVAGRIGFEVQAILGILIQCQFFLLVVCTALANGGIAAMSQALGAGLEKRATRYIGLLLYVSLGLCCLILFLGYFFQSYFFDWLRIPVTLRPLAEELWDWLLLALPANYITIWSIAVFRARKNVSVPLLSAGVVSVLNAVGDFGFGLGYWGLPNYGAKGLLLATVFAVSAGALFNVFMLYRKKLLIRMAFAPLRWQLCAFPYVLKVALPAGGLQFLWQLGYLVLFAITSTLPFDSEAALAGLNVGMRIESILFLPALAFSFTASILVGHCLGAGNNAEAKRVGARIMFAGVAAMSCFAGVLYFWIPEIVEFISPIPVVQDMAIRYMYYNLVATPFTVISLIMSGIMTGAGATVYSFVVYSFATWCVRLPLAWYFGHILWSHASGIFLAMLLSQIFQSVTALYVFFRCDWYRFASTAKRVTRIVND